MVAYPALMQGLGYGGHQQVLAWRKAVELACEAYRLANELPAYERNGLRGQVRRAAASISHNIAEGNASASPAQYSRYLGIARASTNELRSQIELCLALQLLSLQSATRALTLADEVSAMLWTMRRGLSK